MIRIENKLLVIGAIKGCGIGTAIINGIILYFTLPKAEQICNSSLTFNFLGMALGCGLLCPLFGNLTLKGIVNKKENFCVTGKENHLLAQFVPDNLAGAAIVICLLTVLALWAIPYLAAFLLKPQFQLSRFVWLIILAGYAGICASFAVYFGMLRSYFVHKH